MPTRRLVLIVLCVILAAGLTISAGAMVAGIGPLSRALPMLIPAALIATLLLRVLVWRGSDIDHGGIGRGRRGR